jgi:hypothetical protein
MGGAGAALFAQSGALPLANVVGACTLQATKRPFRRADSVNPIGIKRETRPSNAGVFRSTRPFAELDSQLLALAKSMFFAIGCLLSVVLTALESRSRPLVGALNSATFLVGPGSRESGVRFYQNHTDL